MTGRRVWREVLLTAAALPVAAGLVWLLLADRVAGVAAVGLLAASAPRGQR